MNKRLNIGFRYKQTLNAINLFAKQKKMSKSKCIEFIIQDYFANHNINKIKYVFERKRQTKERLSITFKDGNLVTLIEKYTKKQVLSKSNIIEYILEQFFLNQNDVTFFENYNSNDELSKYFERDFGRPTFLKYVQDEHDLKKIKRVYSNSIDFSLIDIEFCSDGVYLDHLNKKYNDIIKSIMISIHLNNDIGGFCYIVLSQNVKLIRKILLDKKLEPKMEKPLPIAKKKYLYSFQIEFSILEIGKIIEDKTSASNSLGFVPFDRNGILERYSKHIDLSSIEYISRSRFDSYQRLSNHYRLASYLTTNKGCYFIKVLDKPKSMRQYLNKKNIHKIDEKFIISQIPNAKNKKLSNNTPSLVNILPLLNHTKIQVDKK